MFPRTIFFWAPVGTYSHIHIVATLTSSPLLPLRPRHTHITAKWGLVIAGLKDLQRPASKLSVPQNVALAATGFIWVRYSLVITPVNYSLAAVNFCVGATGLGQLYRIWEYVPFWRGSTRGLGRLLIAPLALFFFDLLSSAAPLHSLYNFPCVSRPIPSASLPLSSTTSSSIITTIHQSFRPPHRLRPSIAHSPVISHLLATLPIATAARTLSRPLQTINSPSRPRRLLDSV